VCVSGVVLASIGSGLGEFTFLSLTAHFDKSVRSVHTCRVVDDLFPELFLLLGLDVLNEKVIMIG